MLRQAVNVVNPAVRWKNRADYEQDTLQPDEYAD